MEFIFFLKISRATLPTVFSAWPLVSQLILLWLNIWVGYTYINIHKIYKFNFIVSFQYISGIVIRYFNTRNLKIVSLFPKLARLKEFNANAIVAAVQQVLGEVGLRAENLVGLGTDNASVMIGINNDVFVKLMATSPKIIFVALHLPQLTAGNIGGRWWNSSNRHRIYVERDVQLVLPVVPSQNFIQWRKQNHS